MDFSNFLHQGHCHPKVMKALIEQAERLTLSSRAFYNDKFPTFAEHLTQMFGYDMMLPMNTGAEGVETALKLARKWGYEKKKIPKDEVEKTPHLSFRNISCKLFSTCMNIDNAVIIPPDGYLKSVRDLCSRHNILMIADEIQTGIARTGKMLACDWENVRPDVVVRPHLCSFSVHNISTAFDIGFHVYQILGKALGAGVIPVSAVLADKEIMLCIKPGEHGSTFGGNPLASAVAVAALDVIRDEGLTERDLKLNFCLSISDICIYFLSSMEELNEATKAFGDVLRLDLPEMQKKKPKAETPTSKQVCDRCGRDLHDSTDMEN
ncbi:hypothetical protein B296_00009743 [Ensete ventricosum]|uniref:Ornithine aminotransferase n=1 Tax=Ensete ventricosum TaxID=4639 RepID=A0A427B2J5_ENSVE|nr:hypothetical protein B296_00009743 [Ensete ventricosum]